MSASDILMSSSAKLVIEAMFTFYIEGEVPTSEILGRSMCIRIVEEEDVFIPLNGHHLISSVGSVHTDGAGLMQRSFTLKGR